MSLLNFIEKYDADHGIPRPMTAPHLNAYHAALRCLRTGAEMIGLICCGLLSAYLFWLSADLIKAQSDVQLIFIGAMLLAFFVGLMEAGQLIFPYYRITQRLTHGSAMWADSAWLKSQGFAQDFAAKLKPGDLRLGSLPTGHQLVLPSAYTMRHLAIFGPPGSGKSATFISTFLKNWATLGSTVVLDPKGELFEQTASKYRRVYRLDLMETSLSDYWNFLPDCKGDAELAHQIASIIVGTQPGARVSDSDTFWRDSEIAALSAILLHLPQIVDEPTPAMINEFIALRSIDPLEGQTESPLTKEMMESPDPKVKFYWGAFRKAKRDLQGSILTGVIAKCQSFMTPNVKEITSKLAEDDSKGRTGIDLNMLRNPGTAIYVVIPEGDADRYSAFLTTFFGLAMTVLRTVKVTAQTVPTLFMFDEAGNIPIHGLKEMLGVGRGRKVAVVLAYQNLGQVYAQYGRDGGDAVLGSINSMVFLPGLDQRTTEFAASRVGPTTVLQHTSIDAVGNENDAERLAETKRYLIDPAELRQLVRHKQAVAIIDTAPPIKFAYPPFAPAAKANPPFKGTPVVIDFTEAEAHRNSAPGKVPLKLAASNSEDGDHVKNEQPNPPTEKQVERDRIDQPSRVSSVDLNSVE
jgi:type IV secretion system protein VirD4